LLPLGALRADCALLAFGASGSLWTLLPLRTLRTNRPLLTLRAHDPWRALRSRNVGIFSVHSITTIATVAAVQVAEAFYENLDRVFDFPKQQFSHALFSKVDNLFLVGTSSGCAGWTLGALLSLGTLGAGGAVCKRCAAWFG